jgi:hypothetical protein
MHECPEKTGSGVVRGCGSGDLAFEDLSAGSGGLRQHHGPGKNAGAVRADIAKIAPLVRRLRPRLLDFNERIREAAEKHGVTVVDSFAYPVSWDPRLWSSDRIHATPLGHATIAAAAADALGLPDDGADWRLPLLLAARQAGWRRVGREIHWLGTFSGLGHGAGCEAVRRETAGRPSVRYCCPCGTSER